MGARNTKDPVPISDRHGNTSALTRAPSGKGGKKPIIAAPIYAYITRFVYICTTSLSATRNGITLIHIGRI